MGSPESIKQFLLDHLPDLLNFLAFSNCEVFWIDLPSAHLLYLLHVLNNGRIIILFCLSFEIMTEVIENLSVFEPSPIEKLEKFRDLGESNSLFIVLVQEDLIIELHIDASLTDISP